MFDQSGISDYVSDVWKDIDDLLRVDGAGDDSQLELWMRILCIFQSKADVFGISREDVGLPIADADQLYIQRITNGHTISTENP